MKNEDGKPVKVDETRKINVTAGFFLLKAHAPEKYREIYPTEVAGKDGGAVKVETDVRRLPTAELDRIIAGAAARGALPPELCGIVARHTRANGGNDGSGGPPEAGDNEEGRGDAEV